jgi:N-[(2S)-2-amino-2-carboxyethyl]-L-glutamate dehydrogenase
MRYLSRADVAEVAGDTSDLYVEAVRRALVLHASGRVVQPLKPYLRWRGEENHIADRIIAMPAYLGGEDEAVGIKWVGSKHDNPVKRGIPRASAVIVLNDPQTHYPVCVMEGGLISGMRTAAVTALACEHLARRDFRSIGVVGCGEIGTLQVRTLLERFPAITNVHLYDVWPENAVRLAAEARRRKPGAYVHIENSAAEAVSAADVVVPCTTTDTPYIEFAWLRRGAFVCNISVMDVKKSVFLLADKVVVDDWDQANREKKTINQLVLEGRFSREELHAELGEIVSGAKPGRENDEEIILLNPMGMAAEDIACASAIYTAAVARGIGQHLDL